MPAIMNVTNFLCGSGRLTAEQIAKYEAAADKHGVDFRCISGGNNGQCICGHGCSRGACREKTWWFEGPNRGDPFNAQLALRVAAELN